MRAGFDQSEGAASDQSIDHRPLADLSGTGDVPEADSRTCPPIADIPSCVDADCSQVFSCATLDLIFTENTLPEEVSLKRSSSAGYLDANGRWKYAAQDEPRFDHVGDPPTARGLLLEGPSRNLIPWSNDLDRWAATGVTAVQSADEKAPDGSDAWLLTTGTSAEHLVAIDCASATAAAITVSAFVKPLRTDHRFRMVLKTSKWIWTLDFDIPNDALHSSGPASGDSTYRRVAYPGGWFRISYSYSLNIKTLDNEAVTMSVGIDPDASIDGKPSLALWGLQLEPHAIASSYIPTSGAPADRAPDRATIANAGWLGQQGTLLVDLWPLQKLSSVTEEQAVLSGSISSYADRFQLLIHRNSRWLAEVADESSELSGQDALWGGFTPNRTLVRFGQAGWALFEKGQKQDEAAFVRPTISVLRFGSDEAPYYGHLRRLTYWEGVVTDAVAQTLAP